MSVDVDTGPLRQLERSLQRLAAEAPDAAADVLDDVAEQALDGYRRDLPDSPTGRTRDGADRNPAKRTSRGATVEVGNSHFVARFLEEGTVRQPPRPYLDRNVHDALDRDFGSDLDRELRRRIRS